MATMSESTVSLPVNKHVEGATQFEPGSKLKSGAETTRTKTTTTKRSSRRNEKQKKKASKKTNWKTKKVMKNKGTIRIMFLVVF